MEEPFTSTDAEAEVARLSEGSKKVHWNPVDSTFFDLLIPPTVYPPRHDSDLLARRISYLGAGRGRSLLDIGCGSGAISILAASFGWKVSACDINPFAVAATRGNLELNHLQGDVKEGGIGPEPFPFTQQFDLIVWNLPYIPLEESGKDFLGPMEEAALLDTDSVGLAGRLLTSITNEDMLAPNGRILIVGRKCTSLGTFGFAHRTWDKLSFDDGEELFLTCLWKPFEGASNHYVKETGSTNSDLLKSSGIGSHLRAGKQLAGKGRRGREWTSIEDCYAGSWIVAENTEISPGNLQLAGGLAVLESLQHESLRLKWPNDILIDTRKVCGILAEGRSLGDGTRVVLGIGINLKNGENDLDIEIASVDELFEIDAARLDITLHAEIASLLEERNDVPSLDYNGTTERVLEHMRNYGRPVVNGVIHDSFGINENGELVLGDGTIITDGEDIEWT